VKLLASASGPVAVLIALGMTLLGGAIGAVIDLVAGTQGWWLALGSLTLCFAALWLASVATRAPRVEPRSGELEAEVWDDEPELDDDREASQASPASHA